MNYDYDYDIRSSCDRPYGRPRCHGFPIRVTPHSLLYNALLEVTKDSNEMVAGLTTSLLSLLLPIIVLAGPHGSPPLNRHHDLARREISHTDARFTYYEGGGALGSCGSPVNDDGFTVALNAEEMGMKVPSALCYTTITITYQGKSAQATIVDTCPGCPLGGLDLTPALFAFFADISVGVITGDWNTDGSETASAPPAAPPPSPTRPSPTPTNRPSPTLISTHSTVSSTHRIATPSVFSGTTSRPVSVTAERVVESHVSSHEITCQSM